MVQTVARTQTLNTSLRVSGGEEHVEVSTDSEILDRNTSAVTGLIERKQADELPLNGRNWASLTAYIPGAIDTGGSNQRSIRFAGRGLDDSNFTYDGVDATNVANQTQRAWAWLAIPLEAIAEFRVDTLLGTAEESATGGAQLAVVSPAGTNQVHGRLFEFLRNNIFDAPEPIWASNGESQQPLRLKQFGGALGGPVVHDKTLFFLASEAYRQVWGYPTSDDVPSAAFKASIPTSSPLSDLNVLFPQPRQLGSAQTTAKQDRNHRHVSDAVQALPLGLLKESRACSRLSQLPARHPSCFTPLTRLMPAASAGLSRPESAAS